MRLQALGGQRGEGRGLGHEALPCAGLKDGLKGNAPDCGESFTPVRFDISCHQLSICSPECSPDHARARVPPGPGV
ncbi:hypothetical protein X805_16990 [Sphaerotilus natans subsp. natans DSM 6575]|uniref:Uncharacterized protein n=1 Tax=Sphaerotilus natans subsp. natans DSM 6575 TaxID=1286631 RepID=A0A059KNL8_9BURK|nr:hypothetical protein X805_16990 [Sphaerotilus natans subsp. natans DSM 6575]